MTKQLFETLLDTYAHMYDAPEIQEQIKKALVEFAFPERATLNPDVLKALADKIAPLKPFPKDNIEDLIPGRPTKYPWEKPYTNPWIVPQPFYRRDPFVPYRYVRDETSPEVKFGDGVCKSTQREFGSRKTYVYERASLYLGGRNDVETGNS